MSSRGVVLVMHVVRTAANWAEDVGLVNAEVWHG